jgi:membrane-associated protein
MDLHHLLDVVRHLPKYLPEFTAQYGNLMYLMLFATVFCETGLVIMPFLPGDSLLFAAGAVSAAGSLNVAILYPLFITAALLGDNLNYWIGRTFGRRLFGNEKSKVFKRSNLQRTEAFFDKHGPKALILARFVPIVRTFTPFVAGMGRMPYQRFLAFSAFGALVWVGVCVTAGMLLGRHPFVSEHFDLLILIIIAVSLVPVAFEVIAHRRGGKRHAAAAAAKPAAE